MEKCSQMLSNVCNPIINLLILNFMLNYIIAKKWHSLLHIMPSRLFHFRAVFIPLIFILLFNFNNTYALDRITRTNCISVSGGIPFQSGITAEIGYSTLLKPRLEFIASVSGLNSKVVCENESIPINQLSAELGISHIIIAGKRKSIALWLEIKCLAGYESINHDKQTLDDGKQIELQSRFIYGCAPSLRLEIPISRHIGASVSLQERIIPPSSAGLLQTNIILGLKFRI